MSQQETFEWLRRRSEQLGKLEEAMAGWCSTHGSFEPDTGGRCPQCTAGTLRVTQAVLGRAEEPPPGHPDEMRAERAALSATLDAALEGWPEGSLGRQQVLRVWEKALAFGATSMRRQCLRIVTEEAGKADSGDPFAAFVGVIERIKERLGD